MTDATAAQPLPVPNAGPRIVDLVKADLDAKAGKGAAKYGVYLQAHNGRDPLIDLYQELLDGVQYLRQELEERAALDGECKVQLSVDRLNAELDAAMEHLRVQTEEADRLRLRLAEERAAGDRLGQVVCGQAFDLGQALAYIRRLTEAGEVLVCQRDGARCERDALRDQLDALDAPDDWDLQQQVACAIAFQAGQAVAERERLANYVLGGVRWHEEAGHCPTWTGDSDVWGGSCRCDVEPEL
jgi:hypothetical protein